ncbi:MAG: hypothetical protein E6I08_05440 [Chloroflexi bacterium]|nr:MAG: hypothetical protein E6I08_05440 [Chloroflexota bacterium]
MNISVCPADTVDAPADVVWRTLTRDYPGWIGGEVRSVAPPGPMAPGQVIQLVTRELGLGFRVRVEIGSVDVDRRRVGMDIRLPFGVMNHELVTVDPTAAGGALVRFN